MSERDQNTKKADRFWKDATIPLAFVALLWLIHFLQLEFDLRLSKYAVFPRKIENLTGILFTPLLHGSWQHLFNNTVPLLVLGWALFQFYREIAWKTIFWLWIMSGLWLWMAGRANFHIGASGVVYGLATFLFFSGWIRKEKRVAALSLLVAFLYGSLWWGVLPVDPGTSWEGHLFGGVAGLVLAVVYRKQGIQPRAHPWEDDEAIDLSLWDGMVEYEEVTGLGKSGHAGISKQKLARPPRYIRYFYEEKPAKPRDNKS